MLTVAPSSTVHVVLREMATNDDILEAAFMGHVVLHRLEQVIDPRLGAVSRADSRVNALSPLTPPSPVQTRPVCPRSRGHASPLRCPTGQLQCVQRESTTRKEPPLRLPTIEVPVKFRRMVQRIAPGTWKGSKITVRCVEGFWQSCTC